VEKRIQIEIGPDGRIFAKTIGIKGNSCLEYITFLEHLLQAKVVDSDYTEEYFETNLQISEQNKQIIKGE
jgi:hypothetical protein